MTSDYRPLSDIIANHEPIPILKKGEELGWKSVSPGLRSWFDPAVKYYPGTKLTSEGKPGEPCPSFPGDGYCLALNVRGASQAQGPTEVIVRVAYQKSDVLGGDQDKIRVRNLRVIDVVMLRDLSLQQADLSKAYLVGIGLDNRVDLAGADLSHANLYMTRMCSANLSGANLIGATLDGANLSYAHLQSANMSFAILSGANLHMASLQDANLNGADLAMANLYRANLRGANLKKVDFRGANLTEAELDKNNVLRKLYNKIVGL